MRRVYTLLIALAVPLACLAVLWQGLRDRRYWRGWSERFGGGPALPGQVRGVWVHAVSVGEVQAATSLVAALRQERPAMPVALTSATPAGRERAQQACGADVDARYGPYDLPWCVRGTLARVRPALLVIMETELWPNLLNTCAQRGVPVLIASASLSARSARRWRWFTALLQPALRSQVIVAAQTADDARRFESLGVAAARVLVCGNLKFDRGVSDAVLVRGRALRVRYAGTRALWVAGSTHAGEEQAALRAHVALQRQLRARNGDAVLVLAPRHQRRFQEVAELLDGQGLRWLRHSTGDTREVDVVLLDTIGELEQFYAAADAAFVGGSLVPVGGHNLLEPAALGVATLTGPHQHGAPDVARLLQAAGGLLMVRDASELAVALSGLFDDGAARARLAAAGKAVVEANRGALSRVLALVSAQLA